MAIAPSLGIRTISNSVRSLGIAVTRVRRSSFLSSKILMNKTKVKRSSLFEGKRLFQRKKESVRFKDQESSIEASKLVAPVKRGAAVIARSAKGFLGRLLDFTATLVTGWLLYNLPTIISMAKELMGRITRMVQILKSFIGNIGNVLRGFGNLLGAVFQNITSFDFLDTSKRVDNAMKGLTGAFDDMGAQIDEGIRLITTSLGEGLVTGENAPEFGTKYPEQPEAGAPSGGRVGGIHKQALDIIAGPESGGSYNAMNQGTVGPNDRIVGSTGNSKTKIGKELTSMTLGEIMQRQAYLMDKRNPQVSNYGIYAAGKYQLIPGTFESAMKRAGLKSSDMFSPENQDLMGLAVLKSQGIGAWTAGGSKYSAKERAIIQQAKTTPISYSTPIASPQPSSQTPSNPQQSKNKKGKIIEYLTGDRTSPKYRADHAAGNYHDHIGFDSQETRDAAMQWLRGKGWTIGSINTGKHVAGSLHYKNLAFDIPFYPNQSRKGVTDDAKGETKLSSQLRSDLASGGFVGQTVGGGGGGTYSTPTPTPPAQIAAQPQQRRQQVPSQITPERKGQQIVLIDDVQPQQPPMPTGGGGGGMIPIIINPLNSYITNKLLLDLAYT